MRRLLNGFQHGEQAYTETHSVWHEGKLSS